MLGKVINEQLRMLSDGYNAEQRDNQVQIPKLQAEIQDMKAASTNVDIVYKYTDLQHWENSYPRTQ